MEYKKIMITPKAVLCVRHILRNLINTQISSGYGAQVVVYFQRKPLQSPEGQGDH